MEKPLPFATNVDAPSLPEWPDCACFTANQKFTTVQTLRLMRASRAVCELALELSETLPLCPAARPYFYAAILVGMSAWMHDHDLEPGKVNIKTPEGIQDRAMQISLQMEEIVTLARSKHNQFTAAMLAGVASKKGK